MDGWMSYFSRVCVALPSAAVCPTALFCKRVCWHKLDFHDTDILARVSVSVLTEFDAGVGMWSVQLALPRQTATLDRHKCDGGMSREIIVKTGTQTAKLWSQTSVCVYGETAACAVYMYIQPISASVLMFKLHCFDLLQTCFWLSKGLFSCLFEYLLLIEHCSLRTLHSVHGHVQTLSNCTAGCRQQVFNKSS